MDTEKILNSSVALITAITGLITSIAVLIGAVKKMTKENKINESYTNPLMIIILSRYKIFIMAIVLLLGSSGFIAFWFLDSDPQIEIKCPIDGSVVSMIEEISGESKNIPSNKQIWIVIKDSLTGYYFPNHSQVQIMNDDGEWKDNISIGATSDIAKCFYISSGLMDSSAVKGLQRNISPNTYSGLDRIPFGFKSYHTIKVRRKKGTNHDQN
jgi:hypothetical protein